MRHYPNGKSEGWIGKHVEVTFDRRTKTHQPFKTDTDESSEAVVETFYTCDDNSVTFENEQIPVINK